MSFRYFNTSCQHQSIQKEDLGQRSWLRASHLLCVCSCTGWSTCKRNHPSPSTDVFRDKCSSSGENLIVHSLRRMLLSFRNKLLHQSKIASSIQALTTIGILEALKGTRMPEFPMLLWIRNKCRLYDFFHLFDATLQIRRMITFLSSVRVTPCQIIQGFCVRSCSHF